MRKFIIMMAASSLSALMALTSTAPAQAMPFQALSGVQQQSDARSVDIQTVDWRDHRRGWDRRGDRRDDWRRDRGRDRHHRHHGANGAAIIGGLAAGAIIGGAIANSNNNRYYYHNGRRYLRD